MNSTNSTDTTKCDQSPDSPAIAQEPAAKPYHVTAAIKATFEFFPGEVNTPDQAVSYAADIIRELDLAVTVGGAAITAEWSGAPAIAEMPAPSEPPAAPSSLAS